MDRKAVAQETMVIMKQGFYEYEKRKIDIQSDMQDSVQRSILITPEQGEALLAKYAVPASVSVLPASLSITVENISTVDALKKLTDDGKTAIGILNFASAKNPGGGFLNGAMAQEESLAASSTLYRALTAHEKYYQSNRAQRSMMYTDYAIYAPGVVFFRDGRFSLIENTIKASVLTLPAVNMGQVLFKGEDVKQAEQVMRRRMKLALAIFADQGAKNLVLGAYGCGVFRNDPDLIAAWWKELLEEGMWQYFETIFHAVLDHSKNGACIRAFEKLYHENTQMFH